MGASRWWCACVLSVLACNFSACGDQTSAVIPSVQAGSTGNTASDAAVATADAPDAEVGGSSPSPDVADGSPLVDPEVAASDAATSADASLPSTDPLLPDTAAADSEADMATTVETGLGDAPAAMDGAASVDTNLGPCPAACTGGCGGGWGHITDNANPVCPPNWPCDVQCKSNYSCAGKGAVNERTVCSPA